jgi:hypothetical protein
MRTGNQIFLWIAFFSVLVFSAIVELFPLPDAGTRLDTLPGSGTLFSSRDLPLTTGEISIFGQARTVKRFYQFGKQRFILVVIDGSMNRHAVHDPLYCLSGSGWQIKAREGVDIEGGRADLLQLSKKDLQREALYWFSDGSSRHASVIRYWLQTTLRRLTFGRSGPEPVLVILQSIGNDRPGWRTLIDQCGLLFDF